MEDGCAVDWFGWMNGVKVAFCIKGIIVGARMVLMVVSGEKVWGRLWLGWMDGVKVALFTQGMTAGAARQCVKDRKKSRALVHVLLPQNVGSIINYLQ